MERKFEPAKLYKLTKLIVNIITILGLVWLILLGVNYNETSNFNFKFYNECVDDSKGSSTLISSCFEVFSNLSRNYDNNLKYAAILGIVLPVFFYGGGSLYRYLFPKVKK